MTNEELIARIQRGEDVNECMAALYNQNKKFLRMVVKPYAIFAEEEDLMQEAFFGLYTAAIKFDWDQHAIFLTYAEYWVRQSVQRYLENLGSTIRTPVSRRQQVYQYRRVLSTYEACGEAPTGQELCKLLSISPSVLESIRAADFSMRLCKSIDEIVNPDNDLSLVDMIADPKNYTDDILDRVENSQLRIIIDKCMEDLPEDERTVIQEYYFGDQTLTAIAKMMGKSLCRISAIKKSALKRLKKMHSYELWPFYENVCAMKMPPQEPEPEEGCFSWFRDPAMAALRKTNHDAWMKKIVEQMHEEHEAMKRSFQMSESGPL